MILKEKIRLSPYVIPVKVEENIIFLLHGYTGGIDLISVDLFHKIAKNKIAEIDDQLYQRLVKRGILTSKTLSEERSYVKKITNLCKKRDLRFSPVTATIVVTYECNFNCAYCFEKDKLGLERKGIVISSSQVDSIFRSLELLREKGRKVGRMITLFGGEPLLAKHVGIIEYIVNKGFELGYSFSVTTNGYEVDKFLDLFARDKIAGAQITIDGVGSVHDFRRPCSDGNGTFEKIIRNIILLLNKGVAVRVRVNVDSDNIECLKNLETEFQKLGLFDYDCFSMYFEFIGGERNYNPSRYDESLTKISYSDYIEKVSKCNMGMVESKLRNRIENAIKNFRAVPLSPSHCNAHFGNCAFDPYGKVYACMEVLGEKEHEIGVYGPNGIIWSEKSKSIWYDRPISEICHNCKFILLCGGGCYVKSLNTGGHYCDNFPSKLRYVIRKIYAESNNINSNTK